GAFTARDATGAYCAELTREPAEVG
ncbi:MAG: hypothetical protein JWM76_5089, partial [Pseudonocardiales bacterium]|nr:hypothetical protein [Pseudonocardiales bacterium]